ncbi:hypothetical protein K4K59_007676 [Colletotrichum sp. SAR11_240]|nr:hypothetical protein K4K59_007676 [Colletotrichum sp. SAR11_240]
MADVEANIKSDCATKIFTIFPGICPQYFEKTATEHLYDVDKIIGEILKAKSYPKEARPKSLKRKSESSEKEDEVSKVRRLCDFANRPAEKTQVYISTSKKVLCQDFPQAATKSVAKLLKENDNSLMQTYLTLDAIYRNWEAGKTKVGFKFKKTRTPPDLELEPANLDKTLDRLPLSDRKRALEELRAARQVCEAVKSKHKSAEAKVLDEENNFKQAQEAGTIAECGCCFDERPLNRMVHCDNPDAEHYFCVDCARKSAETAIGHVKFELNCNTPFIKETGCNKMTCTRPGCRNVQCYVCSKSCDYSHFDDSSRGGKKGNCPLFEETEVRHDREVRNAGEEARQKVMADNPEFNEEHLTFNTSKRVPDKQKNRKSAQLREAPRGARR